MASHGLNILLSGEYNFPELQYHFLKVQGDLSLANPSLRLYLSEFFMFYPDKFRIASGRFLRQSCRVISLQKSMSKECRSMGGLSMWTGAWAVASASLSL
jgi:hypothetical protein